MANEAKKTERRFFEISDLRAIEADGKRSVGGYAARFNVLSENLGFFHEVREKIEPGAFRKSIGGGDIRAFWNHNTDIILGRTKSGSLSLQEDSRGLSFDLDLADTQAGRDAFTSIKRGDITAMSFGFKVVSDKVDRGANPTDPIIRTLLEVDLFEVSPVAFPAYPQTEVEARSVDEWLKSQMDKWAEEDRAAGRVVVDYAAIIAKRELDLRFQRSRLASCAKR